MATATAIFEISPSIEDDRPQIEFDRPTHARIDWGPFEAIEEGKADVSVYSPIHFIVPEPDARDWNLYSAAGTLGAYSERAVETIGRANCQMFSFLPAFINTLPFYFLVPKEKLDCFDLNSADVVPFPSNPSRVMQIKRYAFHLDRIPDPLMFCIPESRARLFATESVERSIRQARLKGIVCERVF